MNKLSIHYALYCAFLALLPSAEALLLDKYGDPVTAPSAGKLSPADWFANESSKEAGWLQSTCSTDEVRAQEQLERLLQHPDDDDAYYALALDRAGVNAVMKAPGFFYTAAQFRIVSPLLTYRKLTEKTKNIYTGEPGRRFILRMRDFLRQNLKGKDLVLGIYRWLEEDEELTEVEIGVLKDALARWADVDNSSKIQAAYARLFLKEFRGMQEIALSPELEGKIFSRHPALRPFVLAAGALNGMPVARQERKEDVEGYMLHELLWQSAPEALPLARHLGFFGFELLKKTPESLHAYLNGRGIAQNGGYLAEVPACCHAALKKEGLTTRELVSQLPPALEALRPRCLLASGAVNDIWQPVSKETTPAHWPDASAVNLPQWTPALLGLQDAELTTIQTAYDEELQALNTRLSDIDIHGLRGVLLGNMLSECAAVRPVVRDLTLPVYLRIALELEEDGVSISYDSEHDTFRIERRENELTAPIALHLHRLTLLLAMHERAGNTTAMQTACKQLARLLNRHRLWPLIICQRELRGFSPLALLTLFTHYEGEQDALKHYGEAMGLVAEMNLARTAHEDELGDTLLAAAKISGVVGSSTTELEQAVRMLINNAKAAPESELAGEIVSHLLRHGQHRPIAEWQECPTRYFCGSYATNGLRLIRALVKQNKTDAAARVLATMAADKDTDTTPAYRQACALLCNDEQQKGRLHKDALLLALVHRSFDDAAYRNSVEELALAEGRADSIIKAELLLSGGKAAGITPAMVNQYAAAEMWAEAAFAAEYLVAEGISTATPYGTVPSHADLVSLNTMASYFRTKAQQAPRHITQVPAAPSQARTPEALSLLGGTVLGADTDLSCAGNYILYIKQKSGVRAVTTDSPELKGEEKQKALQYCANPSNLRHTAPIMAASAHEAAQLAAKHKLPVLVLQASPQNQRYASALNMYRDLYPESGELLRSRCILLPVSKDLLSGEKRDELLQLEQELAPGTPGDNSPMAQALAAGNMELFGKISACILHDGRSECGYLTLTPIIPPATAWFNLVPFQTTTQH